MLCTFYGTNANAKQHTLQIAYKTSKKHGDCNVKNGYPLVALGVYFEDNGSVYCVPSEYNKYCAYNKKKA